jgi:hypothetical protein
VTLGDTTGVKKMWHRAPFEPVAGLQQSGGLERQANAVGLLEAFLRTEHRREAPAVSGQLCTAIAPRRPSEAQATDGRTKRPPRLCRRDATLAALRLLAKKKRAAESRPSDRP